MNIKELFIKANDLNYDQANGMKKVPVMHGPGFFPGCIGTIEEGIDLNNLPIMVLGQDFDTVEKNKVIIPSVGEIEHNMTWQNLKNLLKEVGLDKRKCFFTNAYMGLRGSGKNYGKSPAAYKKGDAFAKQCHEFFEIQLNVIKPKLVLVLGKETAKFITKVFPGQFIAWEKLTTLKELYKDINNVHIKYEFKFETIHFVFAIHPCLSGSNRSKIWGKGSGKAEEEKILKEIISKIKI